MKIISSLRVPALFQRIYADMVIEAENDIIDVKYQEKSAAGNDNAFSGVRMSHSLFHDICMKITYGD